MKGIKVDREDKYIKA